MDSGAPRGAYKTLQPRVITIHYGVRLQHWEVQQIFTSLPFICANGVCFIIVALLSSPSRPAGHPNRGIISRKYAPLLGRYELRRYLLLPCLWSVFHHNHPGNHIIWSKRASGGKLESNKYQVKVVLMTAFDWPPSRQ